MRFVGLDAGSVSVKAVALDGSGAKLQGVYRPHRGHPLPMAVEVLRELMTPGEETALAVTGSAGRLIASVLGIDAVNEIVAQAAGTRRHYPHVRTIVEMGGEDSKLIILDEAGVTDFAMNSVCAAGTGSFLDQQAERLRLGIEAFGEMALQCERPPRIAGRCSVFAKSDMIHLQQIATPMHDIVAGLCFAVARNFRGSIARGRTIVPPVAFQGGVAANKGMVRAFREVLVQPDLIVPEDFALMGATGAALKAIADRTRARLTPESLAALDAFVAATRSAGESHRPLVAEGDDFIERHVKDLNRIHPLPSDAGRVRAHLGIDIGSISTNVVLVDDEGRLLAKRYLMTAGRPIEAVREGLAGVYDEIGGRVDVVSVGTTGSGRYMIADFVGADIVKNEITAQATAAAFIDPSVDTIFEIGGQDSKYISLKDGVIVDFEMNKACAAGTGSFLEEQAEKLAISVKGEFADCAFRSGCPSRLGERCTVFMENSLMANLQKGTAKDDLLAGLAYSIVQNYINRVVSGRAIGANIFFQGGVAFNKAVVAAFEKYVGRQVTVPPNHDVTGAIGMALIGMRHMLETGKTRSAFKGFAVTGKSYTQSSFECRGCSNLCEINRVKIEGEDLHLTYGGRCEKYDIKKRVQTGVPDLFAFRETELTRHVKEPAGDGRPVIGVPRIFYFNEYLPYWSVLIDRLGFGMTVTPVTNRTIADKGLEAVLSEACYPVKVALGHIRHAADGGVAAVLVPSFVNMNDEDAEFVSGFACPHTQTIPYVAKVAFPELKTITPIIDKGRGRRYMASEILRAFGEAGLGRGLSRRRVEAAIGEAERAQEGFVAALASRGNEALAALGESRAVVIIGRSYSAFERGMNLQIPEKLATLGVLAIPMDMLPTDGTSLSERWPNMYWKSGQRMLQAARAVTRMKNLYPLLIGNFSCGPDSFILKFLEAELGGKPYLHIEIDEHSADAGAITRCEAFLDSIANRDDPVHEIPPAVANAITQRRNGLAGRTVYIPHMSDHAFALKAAFESSGLRAEVLPPSDRATGDIGARFVTGKECYPCLVTTGDMIKKTLEPGFEADASAFFMPSGAGPCRFGQYNVFHREVLDSVGLKDVPVFAPNQDDQFYRALGIVSKDFAMLSWQGIVAIELLTKCLHETRPYEAEPGSADALYSDYLGRVYMALRGNDGKLEDLLPRMRREFEALRRAAEERRPLIGVIGEIFVRSNKFSNEDLVRAIEAQGGEVWLAPVEEWIYYVNYTGLRRALQKRDASVIIDTLLKRFFKHRTEHRYGRYFAGYLRTLREPATKDLLRKAAPYVHDSFEGETILSIGKAVDLAQRGAAGIVNAMPFGCMPGTIVTALMRAVSRDWGVPCISIPYDGTESSSLDIQIEAFMDQARGMTKRQPG